MHKARLIYYQLRVDESLLLCSSLIERQIEGLVAITQAIRCRYLLQLKSRSLPSKSYRVGIRFYNIISQSCYDV